MIHFKQLDLMLRLNPSSLSYILGNQLIMENAHLRHIFSNQLLMLIRNRLLDQTLHRSNSGSISLGSALSLFLIANKRTPSLIAEVGTYIGNSAASMGLGAALNGEPIHLITCDLNQCIQEPLKSISLPEGSKVKVMNSSSTKMFEHLASHNLQIDMLHLDGRLLKDDIIPLKKLIKSETIIALDDCEGDEKGHMNLDLLRRNGLIQNHAYVQPFSKEIFQTWNLETSSLTGFLMPVQSIRFTRQ